ncbi:MAG: hypothetical protein QG610_1698 [Euryarchaeota archaeon]|nr:hypothetical protein [Euryarchaeota archaeon]
MFSVQTFQLESQEILKILTNFLGHVSFRLSVLKQLRSTVAFTDFTYIAVLQI